MAVARCWFDAKPCPPTARWSAPHGWPNRSCGRARTCWRYFPPIAAHDVMRRVARARGTAKGSCAQAARRIERVWPWTSCLTRRPAGLSTAPLTPIASRWLAGSPIAGWSPTRAGSALSITALSLGTGSGQASPPEVSEAEADLRRLAAFQRHADRQGDQQTDAPDV